MDINQNNNFVVTALKQADDGNGLIMRGYNTLSHPIDVSLIPWRPFHNI
jgi:alpha-mannosidase